MDATEVGRLLSVADQLQVSTLAMGLIAAMVAVLLVALLTGARSTSKQLDVLRSMVTGIEGLRVDARENRETVQKSIQNFTVELLKPLKEFNDQAISQAHRIDAVLTSVDSTLVSLNRERGEDQKAVELRQKAILEGLQGSRLDLSGDIERIREEVAAIVADSRKAREDLTAQTQGDMAAARKQGQALLSDLRKAQKDISDWLFEMGKLKHETASDGSAGAGVVGDGVGGGRVGGDGAGAEVGTDGTGGGAAASGDVRDGDGDGSTGVAGG